MASLLRGFAIDSGIREKRVPIVVWLWFSSHKCLFAIACAIGARLGIGSIHRDIVFSTFAAT